MEFFESVQGFIAVECPVCGTRLYFRPEDQGGRIVCDMCHEGLEIPKEVKLKPKPKPVRRRVEGYEVQEEIESEKSTKAPAIDSESARRANPYDLTKEEPPRSAAEGSAADKIKQREKEDRTKRRKDIFLVECSLCYNRMYARVDQVGEEIACPDCGTVMVVPEPPPPREPKPRPMPKPVDVSEEEPPERKYDHRMDRGQARPVETNLPDPPEWTFFSGIVDVLFEGQGPMFWIVVAAGMWVTTTIATVGYGLAGIGGVLALTGLFSPALLWGLSHSATCFWAVMQDTANGAEEIHEWPALTMGDRLGALSRMAFLSLAATSIGYGVGHLASHILGNNVVALGTLLAVWILFPVFVISSLFNQSSFWPLSSTVLASLITLCWGWCVVYLQTGIMLLICVSTIGYSFPTAPHLTILWAAPLVAAVLLISARLYGRLAWRVTAQEYETDKDLRRREERRDTPE